MKKLPSDVHLLLVGEGPLKEKNQNLAKEIGVEDRVHFLGFRNDVPRILRTVDIVVLSSHWEGFGLAAVEGMAAGKPVVASDVPGLRDIVQGAGMLFLKENSAELADKIKKLFQEEDEYNKVVKRCIARAGSLSIKRMLERYINVYKELSRKM